MAQGSPQVQRQIRLPMSKAVEIAYKSIRLRLTRSLVVTSGIVLALAFLMSIFVSESVTGGLRQWVVTVGSSREFVALREQQVKAEAELAERVVALRHVAEDQAKVRAAGEGLAKSKGEAWVEPGAPLDAVKGVAGVSIEALKKELGGFPLSVDDMAWAASGDAKAFGGWLEAVRRTKELRAQLTAPQQVEAKMKAAGVPSTAVEIENNRIQKRWLVGLALLVAFVGILNAMLMSVTERFREIGTMKCLGALDSFIIKLFLIESLFQGVVGTLLGVLVGLGLSLAASAASYGRFAFVNLPLGEILQYVLVCLVIGIGLTVGGAVYPAWQAARMQPIEAMRSDT